MRNDANSANTKRGLKNDYDDPGYQTAGVGVVSTSKTDIYGIRNAANQ
jgi:hypothetical protein